MKQTLIIIAFLLLISCNGRQQVNDDVTDIKNDTISESEIVTDTVTEAVADQTSLSLSIEKVDIVNRFTNNEDLARFYNAEISENLKKAKIANREYYPESIVIGHIEEDTIIGKFDGVNIDTLYIAAKKCGCNDYPVCKHAEDMERNEYYLVSKSGRLPSVRLFAADIYLPRVVCEGDLDGNGTCEIGYMHTWQNSQWRCYRILTWYDNEWRYLIDPNEEYMETSLTFRLSGYEIAKAGKKKGFVLIQTGLKYLDTEVHDTIIKPSYTIIDDF